MLGHYSKSLNTMFKFSKNSTPHYWNSGPTMHNKFLYLTFNYLHQRNYKIVKLCDLVLSTFPSFTRTSTYVEHDNHLQSAFYRRACFPFSIAICKPGFNPFGHALAQFMMVWHLQSLNSSSMASSLSFVNSSRLSAIHLHIGMQHIIWNCLCSKVIL